MVLRYRKLWLTLGWLLVLVIWYLSLVAKPPDIDLNFDWQDKLKHFLAYFTLMTWFSQLYPAPRTRISYAAGFMLMGIAVEYLQAWGGVRMFEYDDMLANGIGVLVAWGLMRGKLSQLLQIFEQRFL